MKNSEKPANPIYNSNRLVSHQSSLESKTHQQYLTGLTKREYFAGLAMQGILANPNVGKTIDGERFVDKIAVSQSSVIIADELLKQLEK